MRSHLISLLRDHLNTLENINILKKKFPKFRNRGVGETNAEKIVVNARKCKNMKFKLGIDIWEKSLKALTTNSSEFDILIMHLKEYLLGFVYPYLLDY